MPDAYLHLRYTRPRIIGGRAIFIPLGTGAELTTFGGVGELLRNDVTLAFPLPENPFPHAHPMNKFLPAFAGEQTRRGEQEQQVYEQ